MPARTRQQSSYDHRLKELVRASGEISIALELGVPRSTVLGWLHDSPRKVVTLDILSLKEQELQHEVLMLRRRIRKLRCLLRLLLTMLRVSEANLAKERVPEGKRGPQKLHPVRFCLAFGA